MNRFRTVYEKANHQLEIRVPWDILNNINKIGAFFIREEDNGLMLKPIFFNRKRNLLRSVCKTPKRNNYYMTIPTMFCKMLGIENDTIVEIGKNNNYLVVKKAQRKWKEWVAEMGKNKKERSESKLRKVWKTNNQYKMTFSPNLIDNNHNVAIIKAKEDKLLIKIISFDKYETIVNYVSNGLGRESQITILKRYCLSLGIKAGDLIELLRLPESKEDKILLRKKKEIIFNGWM